MNALQQFKKDCLTYANLVGNYMDYISFPKNETLIADRYLQAVEEKNESHKNGYMAMLMLRHWKDISKLYNACKTTGNGLTMEDYISVIHNRIMYALNYRAWATKPNLNAQQCINRAISTEKLNQFYFSNLDKNRANFGTISMDAIKNADSDDKDMTLADSIADESTHTLSAADSLIQFYTKKNKLVEAVILDTIAHGDSVSTSSEKASFTYYEKDAVTNEYKEVEGKGRIGYSQFARLKTAKLLKNLPSNYEQAFATKFSVPLDRAKTAVNLIRTAPNQKIYKYLDNTLAELRANKELVADLMH